ncbi:MAG TPA: transcriptional regulator [Micromonosporaceae bacterium]|nr:transcriptional regulator [Micromonosporaceae bacterium]
MHPPRFRAAAIAWHSEGVPFGEICQRLNLPRSTVINWVYRRHSRPMGPPRTCWRCADTPDPSPDPAAYAYLLGQYLGDGHLVTTARVPVLRISCTDAYPRIMDECEEAMRAVMAKSVQRVQSVGCTNVQAYSMHWPCLLPQCGPGKKHQRPIVLEEWQREIVAAHAGKFVRGLFHSDGCRALNNVTVRGRRYSYPRYFFYNESTDILKLCGEALDLLGVQWRFNRRNSLSVAKREAVSILDAYVGAKR